MLRYGAWPGRGWALGIRWDVPLFSLYGHSRRFTTHTTPSWDNMDRPPMMSFCSVHTHSDRVAPTTVPPVVWVGSLSTYLGNIPGLTHSHGGIWYPRSYSTRQPPELLRHIISFGERSGSINAASCGRKPHINGGSNHTFHHTTLPTAWVGGPSGDIIWRLLVG